MQCCMPGSHKNNASKPQIGPWAATGAL
jgi:hypothetical protein